MKKLSVALLSVLCCVALAGTAMAYEAFRGPLGLLQNNPGAYDGYTLVAPQKSKIMYLIDMNGNVINEWKSDYTCFYAELLPNGNVLRHSELPERGPAFGGTTGLIEEFDWAGKKVWEHKEFEAGKYTSHHTFEVMPNGNVLFIGWEYKSYEETQAKGRDMNSPTNMVTKDGIKDFMGKNVLGLWSDYLKEVDKKGNVVWEWHVWDHVGTGPDQFNLNYHIPPEFSLMYAGPDWTHLNGVAYNPKTDELAVTSRNFGEVYIIDRKSGKMTYRWGNPAAYGQGKAPAGYSDDGDQKLFGPHAPDWTAEGTISILDNGSSRPSGNYTRAVELDPRANKVVWDWKPGDVKTHDSNFYSQFQCGAQKLPNGNWLLTTTETGGHAIEVTPAKEIVWEFINPMGKDGKVYASTGAHGNVGQFTIHKMLRYGKDYPGFAGKDMSVKRPLMPKGSPNWVELLKVNAATDNFAPAK